ncbi:phosphopyruvate hydratase [Loigolactobacillus coryniformis]|jgi:enolase|uniref:Enolase n=4 Tax=Loigolactobacillus coryniformis TaxID=1610 RepID=J3JBY7_9LACO|nr:phosphopyruvate hydratase [Loigolactobacillus coryniformis]MDT3391757.1 phosphopyruvate hydratase [Bacillota bacterium]OEH90576.1 enolase [Loigolactobacillus coryniformis subsp. coryniformis]RRG00835.1 MAG: phosphopyruvate hydratase [Lactobacillus sp.]ATO44309.1 phosphopyruvate hydratase [Loigolactobacillus coryniformis subsp. torquens DSM 20004 = KCTC 3535]ATO55999.1 phosphopyruvate hydratase [Loigolactobacillus coryniformis subsp. coryniformis KCTC 3167 = DSM 20001]
MSKSVVIESVKAREVFDSRGNPTVEADVVLTDGTLGRASVPSGASTGELEATELRDGGSRLLGKGVSKAVNNVNTEINDALKGVSPYNQAAIDQIMIDLDGTPNKARLGANAILGVSMATARAAALSLDTPLYRYLGGVNIELPQTFHNVINGGAHADNGIDFQEFMITPIKKTSFRDGIEKIADTYHTLKKVLEDAGFQTGLGDEGGFAPDLKNTDEAVSMLYKAIEQAGYVPGEDIGIALDAASSEFYNEETGIYTFEGHEFNADQLRDYYVNDLLKKFPAIISIEDPFSENDWDNFAKFTEEVGDRVQLVGDDIFVTNPSIFRKGIKKGVANSILIKLNQIGTVSESIEAIRLAKNNGYTTMISHRSGETEDTFVADFAVAVSGGELKTGAMARSERVAKYNQLLRIEEELEGQAHVAHFPHNVDFD